MEQEDQGHGRPHGSQQHPLPFRHCSSGRLAARERQASPTTVPKSPLKGPVEALFLKLSQSFYCWESLQWYWTALPRRRKGCTTPIHLLSHVVTEMLDACRAEAGGVQRCWEHDLREVCGQPGARGGRCQGLCRVGRGLPEVRQLLCDASAAGETHALPPSPDFSRPDFPCLLSSAHSGKAVQPQGEEEQQQLGPCRLCAIFLCKEADCLYLGHLAEAVQLLLSSMWGDRVCVRTAHICVTISTSSRTGRSVPGW